MGPSTAITRFDLSISYAEFNLRANLRKYIGLRVFPALGVANMTTSEFLKVVVEEMLKKVENTERAPRATYKRDGFEFTKDSYALADHGVEEIVDDELIQRYGDVISAEQVASSRAVNRLLTALENEIASTVFTSTWSHKTAVSSGAWSVHSTSKPIDDIHNAIEECEDRIGTRPNTLIMSHKAWRHLTATAQVLDRLDTGSNSNPSLISHDGVKELFNIEEILIGQGVKNTADQGQPASMGRFWDTTMAMVAHINNDGMNGDLEEPTPNIGRTLFYTGESVPAPGMGDAEASIIMEDYREEPRRGGIIRARNHRQVKLLHEEAGHLITGVTA